ncbi:ATP-binding protein [Streptomyces sp. NPDC059785]|uniref:ATP-binding protein n=1 Tax=Streptomyces sp. NPDC059785 TaxID=3346945 RepID=UPI0036480FBC
MTTHTATTLSQVTGVPISPLSAHRDPLDTAALAPPTTGDWGLALGISAAAFAARAFTCAPRSLETVRRFARDVVDDWELHAIADDVITVVGELTTNAVRHALPQGDTRYAKAWLGIARTGGALVCAVADPDPTPPTPPALGHPDPYAETGRGLLIVEALATQWGYTRTDPTGKTVWARIALPPHP